MKFFIALIMVAILTGCSTSPTEFYTVERSDGYVLMWDENAKMVGISRNDTDEMYYPEPINGDLPIVDQEQVFVRGQLIR